MLSQADLKYAKEAYPHAGCGPIAVAAVTGATIRQVEEALPESELSYLRRTRGSFQGATYQDFIIPLINALGYDACHVEGFESASVALSMSRRFAGVGCLARSQSHVNAFKDGKVFDHKMTASRDYRASDVALKSYRNCIFVLVGQDAEQLQRAKEWMERRTRNSIR